MSNRGRCICTKRVTSTAITHSYKQLSGTIRQSRSMYMASSSRDGKSLNSYRVEKVFVWKSETGGRSRYRKRKLTMTSADQLHQNTQCSFSLTDRTTRLADDCADCHLDSTPLIKNLVNKFPSNYANGYSHSKACSLFPESG